MKGPWLVAAMLWGCDPVPLVPPRLVSQVAVLYPEELWDANIEGETLLRVRVDASGWADSALVERSSGYAEFDKAALRGASALRFRPGRRGAEAAAAWVRIPVQFRLPTSTS